MIRVSGLTKMFPGGGGLSGSLGWRGSGAIEALRDVSLEIGRGEVLGLVGPNGGGKTTLLEILATFLLPTAGRAWVAGHDVLRDPILVRRAIGYCPAGIGGFYQRLSGKENLEFFAILSGLPTARRGERIASLWQLVGLDRFRDVAVGQYSDGMRQRLALARALLTDPAVLLLDEPTRGLDPQATAFFTGFFRRLAREHDKTILLATHDLSAVAELCDRVAVMDRARVVASGDAGVVATRQWWTAVSNMAGARS